jgi:hypothetical protein
MLSKKNLPPFPPVRACMVVRVYLHDIGTSPWSSYIYMLYSQTFGQVLDEQNLNIDFSIKFNFTNFT